ncbi:MAG: hypothetical protein ACLFPA_12590 [Dichotomicrobium sp.]
MTKTYIFDRNSGFVQWVSDKTDHMEALQEFDAEVGIDPHDKGLSLDDWHFVDADDELARKLDEWIENGSPASKCPIPAF